MSRKRGTFSRPLDVVALNKMASIYYNRATKVIKAIRGSTTSQKVTVKGVTSSMKTLEKSVLQN